MRTRPDASKLEGILRCLPIKLFLSWVQLDLVGKCGSSKLLGAHQLSSRGRKKLGLRLLWWWCLEIAA
jgi:hypothetical protein